MQLKVFKSLWGMTGSGEMMVRRIKNAGYDGVEGGPPDMPVTEFRALLEEMDLDYIALIGGLDLDGLKRGVDAVAPFEPLRITVHAGVDAMSDDEGSRYFESALEYQAANKLPLAFETHRGRLLYAPWNALRYMKQFPELRVNADFSHWVCVCERLPEDQREALDLACERALHTHGRIGYEEGPQVPDPRAPEFEPQRVWHQKQWDKIRAAHERNGAEVLTWTPEFGPPGYMHTLPYTQMPLADLWEVCLWGAHMIRERWKDLV